MVPICEQSWCDISGWSCAEGWDEEHAHRVAMTEAVGCFRESVLSRSVCVRNSS